MKHTLTLWAVLCLWVGGSFAAAPILIDDFEDYEAGQLDAVTEAWNALPAEYAGSFIAADPLDSTNMILGSTGGGANEGRGAYLPLPEEAIIANGQTKTLFLRFRASAGTNHSFGLAHAAEPGWFSAFSVQAFVIGGNFGVRDGGTTQPRLPVTTGNDVPFYNVWMVVDNAANNTRIYWHQDGDSAATEAHRLILDGRDTFAFRTPDAPGTVPLVSFFFYSYDNTGTVWLDDIYMMDGVDLSNPALQLVRAHEPSPAHGETGVLLGAQLSWNTGLDPDNIELGLVNSDITHHYVYFREDPNFREMTSPTAILAADGPTASYTPEGANELKQDETYYWRVDQILNDGPASDPNFVIPGAIWSFSTVLSAPTIRANGHPEMTFADEGDDVVFKVLYTSFSPANALWYKYVDGQAIPLFNEFGMPLDPSKHAIDNDWSSETTLTVLNATPDDQAQYFAVIQNQEFLSAQTNRASLIIKQLVSHYPLDGDFVDVITGNTGIGLNYPDANLPGPTFGDGLVGGAAIFEAGNYVDLGPNAFPKAGAGNALETGTISVWANPTAAGSLIANFNNNFKEEGEEGLGTGTTGFVLEITGGGQPRLVVRGEPINGSYYHMGDPSGGGSPVSFGDENWYLVTVTWQAGDHMKLYLNGVEVASVDAGVPEEYMPWDYGVLLGAARTAADRSVPSVGFAGAMDDIRVYNYPKDKFEVAELYYEATGVGPCMMDYASEFDLTGNCRVDLGDFALLASNWLSCGRYPVEACHD